MIWDRLCKKYNLYKDCAKSAYHIHAYVCDSFNSFATHYSFTVYRPDNEWRGEPLNRYELQPLVDIARLPEFHYLSYEDTLEVMKMLQNEVGEIPKWVQSPDFFLPSRNIKHLIEKDPTLIEAEMETVSKLLGVGTDALLEYIQSLKDKERIKNERKRYMEKFENTPLGILQLKELKHLLHVHFKVPEFSKRVTKADFLSAVHTEIIKRNLSEKDV